MSAQDEDSTDHTSVSQHVSQQAGQPSRLSALEIFTAAARTGEEELKRSTTGLTLSGLAAGLEMGLTGLGSAVIADVVGTSTGSGRLLTALLYPLGFIVVVLGRSQLFTENTLFPVILVLDRGRHLWNMLRLWGVVFTANILGALLFGVLVTKTPALSGGLLHTMRKLGVDAVGGDFSHVFWGGLAGGWIIALMAWLVTASRTMTGQFAVAYLLTFVVGAAHLAHCIAGSAEGFAAVLSGDVSAGSYLLWLLAAALGNTVGGVLMVSVLNYGQIIGSGQDAARAREHLGDLHGTVRSRGSKRRAT